MLKDFPFYTWPNQIERRNLFLSLFSPMPDVKTTRWPARMNQVLIMVKAWCAGFCSGYLKEGSLRELLSGMALITVPYVLTETVSRISRARCSFFSSFLSFLLPLYLPFPFFLLFVSFSSFSSPPTHHLSSSSSFFSVSLSLMLLPTMYRINCRNTKQILQKNMQ